MFQSFSIHLFLYEYYLYKASIFFWDWSVVVRYENYLPPFCWKNKRWAPWIIFVSFILPYTASLSFIHVLCLYLPSSTLIYLNFLQLTSSTLIHHVLILFLSYYLYILQCSSLSFIYLLLASSTFINLKLQSFIFIFLPLLSSVFI